MAFKKIPSGLEPLKDSIVKRVNIATRLYIKGHVPMNLVIRLFNFGKKVRLAVSDPHLIEFFPLRRSYR